jgi:predicted transcriptional regulator
MSDLHTNGTANRAPTGVQDDIVERLQQVARANGCEAGRGCSEAAAEIERLRAVLDVVDAQVAAYMNGSIGSSQAIQTISRLLDPEEARRG